MITMYFTFGQNHEHNIKGREFNKDTVVKITAVDPRNEMIRLFGYKWSMEYDREPDMSFYPGGIIELAI